MSPHDGGLCSALSDRSGTLPEPMQLSLVVSYDNRDLLTRASGSPKAVAAASIRVLLLEWRHVYAGRSQRNRYAHNNSLLMTRTPKSLQQVACYRNGDPAVASASKENNWARCRRSRVRGQATQHGVVTIVDADIIPLLPSLSSKPCAPRKELGTNGSEMRFWVSIWNCHGICGQ